METFTVGQELKVWSERVLGVPVRFVVTKVGRKYLHGDFYYGFSQWKGAIVPGRIVGR
jgi:hypothetical protein